jgi:fatty-acyl-CoA synthase
MSASGPHARTLSAVIGQHARLRPDAEALLFPADARTVTYRQLHADALSAGAALRELGIDCGDVVMLAMDHGYAVVATFLGAMYAGAIPSILPYFDPSGPGRAYRGQQVPRMVRHGHARAVVALPAAAEPLRALLGPDCRVLSLVPDRSPLAPDGFFPEPLLPGDVAYVQFGSGSTGLPRGALIQHRAALAHLEALAAGFAFGEGDVGVGWLPLHHDMGLVTQVLLPLAVGGRSVLLSPTTWLRRPVALMRAVHRYGGSLSTMPNFAFDYCVRRIGDAEMEGVDLTGWRTLVCGGEPIRWATMQRFAARFAPWSFSAGALMAGYGMAENTVGVSRGAQGEGIRAEAVSRAAVERDSVARPDPTSDDTMTVVSCGRPFTGTDISIVNEFGAPLAERGVGEIRVRGSALFAGYHRRPEETAAAIRDGWFHTGDRGYLAGGELYVVDRRADLIITAGRNLSPPEIEEVVSARCGDSIRRVIAFGVPDERLGTELPVVVVEVPARLEGGRRAALPGQIRQHVREALDIDLADVRLVRSGWVEVTTSGKLARSATLARYLDAGFRDGVAGQIEDELSDVPSRGTIETSLARIVGVVTGRAAVDPHAHLADLGVDSLTLARVALLVEERLGRPVPMEAWALNPTIHHLATLLEPGGSAAASPPAEPQGPRWRDTGVIRRPRWLRMVRAGPQLRGRSLLPYPAGTRLLRSITAPYGPRRSIYREPLELLESTMRGMPMEMDGETVIHRSLMTNTWTPWRQHALARPGTLERWVTVTGTEIVDELDAAGRGALLVFPHSPLMRLLQRLPFVQRQPLAVIGNMGAAGLAAQGLTTLADAFARGVPMSRTAVRSAQLAHAARLLGGGGRAVILADDDDGVGGIQVPFHGRWRPFRPGAAELALRTGAAFVPMFGSMDLDGRISFEVLAPLEAEGSDHLARVRSLLDRYAALLERRYTVELGAMDWYILRKLASYPAVA